MDKNSRLDDSDEIPAPETVVEGVADVSLSPDQHQRIKNIVHSDSFRGFLTHRRKYLICGSGSDSDAIDRRQMVYDRLDGRTEAAATQLEDWGLTKDEIEFWVHLFDKLCHHCTHIVAVLEDFDGGYVWEMGLLFAPSYRDDVWVLKRTYDNPATEREHYENGMAASHTRLLLTGDRAYEWQTQQELADSLSNIP